MVAFIVRLIIYVVISYLINYLFADDGPDLKDAKPGAVVVPTVTASDTIPVLFGTKLMQGPNVVWYGDVGSIPHEKCA